MRSQRRWALLTGTFIWAFALATPGTPALGAPQAPAPVAPQAPAPVAPQAPAPVAPPAAPPVAPPAAPPVAPPVAPPAAPPAVAATTGSGSKPAPNPDTPQRARALTVPITSGAKINDAGCAASALQPNDDGSTAAVRLPFDVDFFGTRYGSLYVNNNGNVTFRGPMETYTPFTIGAGTPPMIAPFFADVDTRGTGSVTYGAITFGSRPAFCVNWSNVGYYGYHTDRLNDFQLLLVARGDVGTGDFDVIMNYGTINWETGDASGGSGGLGGIPAGAGFSAGDGLAEPLLPVARKPRTQRPARCQHRLRAGTRQPRLAPTWPVRL